MKFYFISLGVLIAIAGCTPTPVTPAVAVPKSVPGRTDGRFDNVAIQKAVKAISPADVKEICFVLDGEFPQPLPKVTGPVKSPKDIAEILTAFSKSSRKTSSDPGLVVEHEEVYIAKKDGKTLLLEINGYPDGYEFFYGKEVAQIMMKHHGSCDRKLIEADGLDKNVYRPS